MTTLTASQARADIYNLIDEVEESHKPIEITGKRSQAILIAKSDWEAIQETLHLLSIPGMKKSIQAGLKLPLKKCKKKVAW